MTVIMPNYETAPNVRLVPNFEQPENPFAPLVTNQSLAIISSFRLESGVTLYNVPVAFKTFGNLSPKADNGLVICHALTGSADVSDWWGPLMGGTGKAMDTTRFFVVCLNCLGSPYGSASPVTNKFSFGGDASQGRYGPEFPLTTIRDDVNIFKLVLDALGVRQIAAVIGGSMGGAAVLEFAFLGRDYVRSIIPIATSARFSAWAISWGEAQRQSIYCDAKYDDGYYSFTDPPTTGLGAARMAALLTYRSRDSFEHRFGRNVPDPSKILLNRTCSTTTTDNDHFAIHNDGHRNAGSPRPLSSSTSSDTFPPMASPPNRSHTHTHFSAQAYLRYQGNKFTRRYDANCYIAMTRKCDTHDISRGRGPAGSSPEQRLAAVLGLIEQPTLVLGIESDGLFTFAEQQELAACIPDARLRTIVSREGHDAFLLEFEQVNAHLLDFMKEVLPDILNRETKETVATTNPKTGMVSEVDDITAW